MVLTGYAHCVAGTLTPAHIIDPHVAASGDPADLAAHCLQHVAPDLTARVAPGDVLVLGGALVSDDVPPDLHEAAVLALQAAGFAAVVCTRADAAMLAVAGVFGLPIVAAEPAHAKIETGALLRLDLARGTLENQTQGTLWQFAPCAADVLAATQRAVLLTRMRRVVEDEGYGE